MPNWCENVLEISHDDASMIEKIVEGAKTGLFNAFLPVPEDIGDGWYDWCVSNWGTKWDVDGIVIDNINDGKSVCFSFDTAWSPPIGFYEHLITLGFDVKGFYYEPAMCYCGLFDNGEDNYYDYGGMGAEWVRENIPSEIEEMFCIASTIEEYEEESEVE